MAMKSLNRQRFRIYSLISKLPIPLLSTFSSSSSIQSSKPILTNANLSQEELTKINLLIPHLCSSDNLSTAVQLTSTALLANPPLKTLPLNILIHSLTSEPDMAQLFSLLNRLKYSPTVHHYIRPIATMLIDSYFQGHRPREALKVYSWMVRINSPCAPDEKIYGVVVHGLCGHMMVFDALNVLKAMVDADFVPGNELRMQIYRSLLREARIGEAKDLHEALGCVEDSSGEGLKKVVEILDKMISNWTE